MDSFTVRFPGSKALTVSLTLLLRPCASAHVGFCAVNRYCRLTLNRLHRWACVAAAVALTHRLYKRTPSSSMRLMLISKLGGSRMVSGVFCIARRFPRLFIIAAIGCLGLTVAGSAEAADPASLDSGGTAWVLAASALVLFMTLPGLALVYGGLVGARNLLSVLMHCFVINCIVLLL